MWNPTKEAGEKWVDSLFEEIMATILSNLKKEIDYKFKGLIKLNLEKLRYPYQCL